MFRLYANTMPFYIKGLEHLQILVSVGGLGTSPQQILREDYMFILRLKNT